MLALSELQSDRDIEVVSLLTTVTDAYDRISMHGVRTILLERQAEALGLRVHKVYMPKDANNQMYNDRFLEALRLYPALNVMTIAYGDIFLEDVRKYREELIRKTQFQVLFPLWGRDTSQLMRDFLGKGYKAVIVCVDTMKMPESFLGVTLDESVVDSFPAEVDPCGENGEYHTFVYDGPGFQFPVDFSVGHVEQRGHLHFCDLRAME